MSVSALRPFFISVAAMVVIVLVGFFCGILPESPFLAFIKAEEVNDYLVLFVNLSAPDVFFFMQVKRRYRTKQSDIFFSRLFYPVPSCIISYVTIK